MKFLASAIAAFALAASASAQFTSCGSSSDSFQLSSVSYTPDPPVVGQQVCITLNGALSAPVTQGATLQVSASLWGADVYDHSIDLCASLANSTTPCPIATTVNSMTQCINVPSSVPAGISIDLQAIATSASGSEIFCISGPMTFSS